MKKYLVLSLMALFVGSSYSFVAQNNRAQDNFYDRYQKAILKAEQDARWAEADALVAAQEDLQWKVDIQAAEEIMRQQAAHSLYGKAFGALGFMQSSAKNLFNKAYDFINSVNIQDSLNAAQQKVTTLVAENKTAACVVGGVATGMILGYGLYAGYKYMTKKPVIYLIKP